MSYILAVFYCLQMLEDAGFVEVVAEDRTDQVQITYFFLIICILVKL